MSLEQHPSKANDIHVDNMPPIDQTVIPPKEHRDDKHEKSFAQRHKKKIAGIVLGNVLLAGAAGMYAKKTFTDPIEEALNNPNNPGVSGPVEPGEVNEPTQSIGVDLKPEQVADFESGDPERIGKVFNAVAPQIEEAMNSYMNGEASEVDLSAFASDPMVSKIVTESMSNFQDYPGIDTTGGVVMYTCPGNIPNPDYAGTGCGDRASTVMPGEPLKLEVSRWTFDNDFGTGNFEENNKALVYPEITPEVVDDKFVLTFTDELG